MELTFHSLRANYFERVGIRSVLNLGSHGSDRIVSFVQRIIIRLSIYFSLFFAIVKIKRQ